MAKARNKLRVQQPFGLRVWKGLAQAMPQAHRHGDLELNFVLSGRMTYLVGSSMVTLPLRRLCAIWGAAPHQMLRTSAPVQAVWVTVPLDDVMSWGLSDQWMQLLLKRSILADAQPLDEDLPQLLRWHADLKQADEPRRRVMTMELQARMLRMSLAGRKGVAGHLGEEQTGNPSLKAVRKMAAYIVGHYRQDVDNRQITAAASLHPNYAMSLFRTHTGLTLNQFVTRHRVAEAQRLLTNTDKPILEIAFACGFGSVSRFYEAFGQHAGCTPRQFRVRIRRGG